MTFFNKSNNYLTSTAASGLTSTSSITSSFLTSGACSSAFLASPSGACSSAFLTSSFLGSTPLVVSCFFSSLLGVVAHFSLVTQIPVISANFLNCSFCFSSKLS